MPEHSGPSFSFWKILVGVMLALKLKEKYDECRLFDFRQLEFCASLTFLLFKDRRIDQEDDEERVRLDRSVPQGDNSLTGEGAIALPDDTSTIAPVQATRRKKKKACCMCCGIECVYIWHLSCTKAQKSPACVAAPCFGKRSPLF